MVVSRTVLRADRNALDTYASQTSALPGDAFLIDDWSLQITTDPAPDAPSGLSVGEPTGTSLNLSWTDESDDELGFLIERHVSLDVWTQVAAVDANETTYTDPDLVANREYTYRVRAWNANGTSATTSEEDETTLAEGGNLIYNPSFEAWLAGWTTTQATLTRVAGGQHGNWAARVETNCACSSAKLEDSPHMVVELTRFA